MLKLPSLNQEIFLYQKNSRTHYIKASIFGTCSSHSAILPRKRSLSFLKFSFVHQSCIITKAASWNGLSSNKIVTEDGLKPAVSFISFFRIDLTELDSFFSKLNQIFFSSLQLLLHSYAQEKETYQPKCVFFAQKKEEKLLYLETLEHIHFFSLYVKHTLWIRFLMWYVFCGLSVSHLGRQTCLRLLRQTKCLSTVHTVAYPSCALRLK